MDRWCLGTIFVLAGARQKDFKKIEQIAHGYRSQRKYWSWSSRTVKGKLVWVVEPGDWREEPPHLQDWRRLHQNLPVQEPLPGQINQLASLPAFAISSLCIKNASPQTRLSFAESGWKRRDFLGSFILR